MKISGYIPAYNNSATLSQVIHRLRQQTVKLSEILVIDDGSTDETSQIGEREGVRVIRIDKNKGRGYSRATATEETTGDFILACDSTCGIDTDFVKRALKWLESKEVAAVYGWLWDPEPSTAADRWRNQHLFSGKPSEATKTDSFVTTGSLIRRSAIEKAGNYNRELRHSEDAELGKRIIREGFAIISDPALRLVPLSSNASAQVIERYLRWNLGPTAPHSLKDRLKFAHYAMKTMLKKDAAAKDFGSALITLRCILRSFIY